MADDYITGTEPTHYVRAEDLETSAALRARGWLWPWGIVGLIGFLALTGFFMVLLRPDKPAAVPVNDASLATAPLGAEPVVAAPLPADLAQPNPSVAIDPAAAGPAVAEPAALVPTPADSVPALTGTAPRIAILVLDLGGDSRAVQAAIAQLPDEVDLGFAPNGAAAPMKLALAGGHRVWLGVPMQPKRYPAIDPGPKTLLLKNSADQNAAQLKWAMDQAAPGITGLYNIMGSAFTANETALAPVMAAAKQSGLAFFDTRAGADTAAAKVARAQQIPAAINEAYLDGEPDKLNDRLDELVRRAKSRGVAVGIIGPSTTSIAGLKAWLATPAGQSVDLVSARSVAASADLQKLQP
jgi:uncharacterized protein